MGYNKICPKSIGTALICRASTSTPPILGSLVSLLSKVYRLIRELFIVVLLISLSRASTPNLQQSVVVWQWPHACWDLVARASGDLRKVALRRIEREEQKGSIMAYVVSACLPS